MLLGLMQDRPLMISSLIDYAERYHGDTEIVSHSGEGRKDRTTYAAAAAQARRLAGLLTEWGVQPGDRVATMAWNGRRHYELFYGVSGTGAVLHTVNPRLFHDQIEYILNHAAPKILFMEPDFVGLIEECAPRLEHLERVVILCAPEDMPETHLPKAESYDALVDGRSDAFQWPTFDERAASALCYTSGTTGHPKGVLYSHRSTVLHALAAAHPTSIGVTTQDVVMPVANMYHAAAWGLPYICTMVGAKQVLPGRQADGASLQMLIESEGVTLSGGVPTIWTMLFQHLDKTGTDIESLERVLIGGSAAPESMINRFRDRHGVQTLHIWGMTETSPVGTIATLTAKVAALPDEARASVLQKQGRVAWGCDLKITDEDGRELPHDGDATGMLWVRGPWIASGYYGRDDEDVLDDEGWFPTGDVSALDPYGYMRIADRAKDVIKSGGEWISSVDVENVACGHPDVHMAAVIGVHHPKWEERPLLIVVAKEDRSPDKSDILGFLEGKIAKWWMPDDVVFVDELPLTATGKIAKRVLRDMWRHHLESA